MTDILENLSWLPQPPADFSSRLSLASNGADLRELANFSLNENQLRKLSKRLHLLKKDKKDLSQLTDLNIGLISNATTQLITPVLIGTALRFGISLDIVEAEYNQVAQEAFSAESVFSSYKLDAIIVAIDFHGLPFAPCPGEISLADERLKNCMSYIKNIVGSLRAKTNAQIILQNFAEPSERLFGSYEARLPGTLAWLISRINDELDIIISDDTFILDIEGLASNIGLLSWHDPMLWNMAKLPFSQKYTPIYSEYVCRILAARLGKSRRCLILDLDNTLWGGIIGDDGVEGILIGHGDPTGEAHLDIQQTALDLRARGVVLAVSSKNEDSIARRPFREHPDMVLHEEHIAVFQANWLDKASNIRAIAETLSLGLDSMVFLDDNPAERMQVRKELPEVAIPELPNDPALFSRILLTAGYFEANTFSAEDSKRAAFYQDNAKRTQILNQSSDIEDYLQSLEMEISFSPFDATGRPRITQLINKSNQFNLTTKRYSEAEVRDIEKNQKFYTAQIRLKDVLGDNGMISVLICKKDSQIWEIDTWLMSCRVLGRRVEFAVLQEVITQAKKLGVKKLVGTYIPTDRNMIVKDHYKKLGFKKVPSDGVIDVWDLDVSKYKFQALPIKYK